MSNEGMKDAIRTGPIPITLAFCICSAHYGIYGNEKADMLAKGATEVGVLDSIPLPHRDLFTKYTRKKGLSANFAIHVVGRVKKRDDGLFPFAPE